MERMLHDAGLNSHISPLFWTHQSGSDDQDWVQLNGVDGEIF